MERSGGVAARVPPALLRIPMAPTRTVGKKFRLCARLCPNDIASGRLSHIQSANQILLDNATKSHSKNAFDTVFGAESAQDEVSSNILPDLLHTLFNGSDCSLVAFGGFSKGKESCLYEPGPSNLGLFQSSLSWTFRLIEEYRTKRPEFRYSVRISAVYFSQRENQMTDLLTQFNSDPRRHSVRVTDDPSTGTAMENESEIRVESVDQAMFYLNTVIDHRLVEDEDSHRVNHLFFTISLYGFRAGTTGIESGGKTKLSIVDLGIGERNSQKGEVTMPVVGNMLLALCQGQKYIPSRENLLCLLLKVALVPSKNSVLLCSFTERSDENENMMQLASKLARAKRNTRRTRPSENGSLSSGSIRRTRSDVESSSEQSAAETVIFMGPQTSQRPLMTNSPSRTLHLPPRSPSQASGSTLLSNGSSGGRTITSIPPLLKNHTPFFSPISRLYDDLCSPSTSTAPFEDFHAYGGVTTEDRDDYGITIAPPKKSKSKQNLDDEKRKAIMTWMDGHQAERADTAIQCGDGDVGREWEERGGRREADEEEGDEEEQEEQEEERDQWPATRPPLEDIIEMDEESMKSSLRSNGIHPRDIFAKRDPREREGLAEHPLSILSREHINHISSTNENAFDQEEGEDDELERAMAASISSIKSHEILSRVANEIAKDSLNTNSGTVSEMDLYRRASHLEGYAAERIKELDEQRKKEKKKNMILNCCQQQQSMTSSVSTIPQNWEQLEKKREKEEERKRKEDLRRRKDELKVEELEIRRQRAQIKKELDEPALIPPIAQNIARQISNQLHKFNLGGSPKHQLHPLRSSDSLPSTPTVSHRKLHVPVRTPSLSNMGDVPKEIRENGFSSSHNPRPQLFQPLAPKANSSSQLRHSSKRVDSSSRDRDSRKSSKTRSRERRSSENSKEEVTIRSPYTKVTEAKKDSGGGSSGRGSDDNGSGVGLTALAARRNRNRDSYSASSGYESASADYHKYTSHKDSKLRILDKNYGSTTREIDRLRDTQRRLKRELMAARERLGQRESDNWRSEHDTSAASPQALIDTLLQENRILEKRLIACQNHAMIVTSFL